MNNRRELARLPVRRVMKPLRAGFATKTVRAHGHIVNLSRAGMFVATESLPQKDEPIKVLFEDAGGLKMEVRGAVRWTGEEESVGGFGMRIEKPSDDYLEFCAALIEALGEAFLPA